MSTTCVSHRDRLGGLRSGVPFTLLALALAAASACLAGWLPLGLSIVIVFLFAGPHNWLEMRYFLTRLPARWGRLRGYFLFSFAGMFALTAAYAALPWLARLHGWGRTGWFNASAVWNTALVLWVATLVQLRSRQNPRRNWSWTLPIALLLIALAWVEPFVWGFGVVYAHPFVAFWVLDRELCRSRPEWRPAYHLCLLCVPLLLGVLWWRLAGAPDLPGTDRLSILIAEHAGAGTLRGISTHLLVAAHAFLEILHYGIWVVVIPLVALREAPWEVRAVPLARRSEAWRQAVLGLLALGAVVVLLLWGCFLADYPTTREVYFTVALLHVLAEVPFLLRML